MAQNGRLQRLAHSGVDTRVHAMIRRWVLIVLTGLVVMVGVIPAQAATPRTRCFAETGYCVSDPILAYWERNGGLAVFGYPIGAAIPNEVVEGTWVGTTQWFERDRLEDHGSLGVMAGRMGALMLERQWRPWQYGPGWPGNADCRYFAETGYTACGVFLRYWAQNGGLERFGYPITTELTETIGTWTGRVQYFERRRMEHHTELAGTAYEVLLGRLAADVFAMTPPVLCTPKMTSDEDVTKMAAEVPFRERLGCPNDTIWVQAAVQTFANGRMIWLNTNAVGEPSDRIIVTYTSTVEPGQPTIYAKFADDWQAGIDPEVYAEGNMQVVPYSYPLTRGFGKVWFRSFRRGPIQLTPALSPEVGQMALVQRYSSGALIILLQNDRIVYAFGPNRDDVAGYLPGR